MSEQIDIPTMFALGFLRMPAGEAIKKFPMVSKDGDDVWWHPGTKQTLWVQGLPAGEQLFGMIYRAGMRVGSMQVQRDVRDALGIASNP